MSTRIPLISCAVLLFLSGCATTQSIGKPSSATADEMKADSLRVMFYCKQLFEDASLDPMRLKVNLLPLPFGDKSTTFDMISNAGFATEDEKPIIATWARKIEDCSNARWISMRKFSPPITPQEIVLEESIFPRFQFLIADLYNHTLSFGQFSRKRSELSAEYSSQLISLRQSLSDRAADAQFRADQIAQEARKAAAMEEQASNLKYARQRRESEAIAPRLPLTCTTYFNMTTCQ